MKDAFQDLQGITEAITTAQVTAALIEVLFVQFQTLYN